MNRRAFFRGLAGTVTISTGTLTPGLFLEQTEQPLMSYSPVCPQCGAYALFHGPSDRPLEPQRLSCSCGWAGSAPRAIPLPRLTMGM